MGALFLEPCFLIFSTSWHTWEQKCLYGTLRSSAGSRLEVSGLGGCKPISPSSHASVLQRHIQLKAHFHRVLLNGFLDKFLLDYKAEFDFILPVIHPFYMSYSQEDLVRSRHFTTENNFESIHTLGGLIGAYVHRGCLTSRVDGRACRSHGVSFLLHLMGRRKEHLGMCLFNFTTQVMKITYLSEICS